MGNATAVVLYGSNYDVEEQRPDVTTSPFVDLTGLVSTTLNCFTAKNTIDVQTDIKKFINDYSLGTNKIQAGYDLKTEYNRTYTGATKQSLATAFPELNIINNNKYFWIYSSGIKMDFVSNNIAQAVNVESGSLGEIDEYITLELKLIKRKLGL